jgi:hypothetical protein
LLFLLEDSLLSHDPITRRHLLMLLCAASAGRVSPVFSSDANRVEPQPYFASVTRAIDSLAALGAPMLPADAQRISELSGERTEAAVQAAETLLDAYTLARLSIRQDGTCGLDPGGASPVLVEQGWRMFLVRVDNAPQRACSMIIYGDVGSPGQMTPGFNLAPRPDLMDTLNKAPLIEKMWFLLKMHGATSTPVGDSTVRLLPLSGIPIEYHVVQIFSRDRGRRKAPMTFLVPKTDRPWPVTNLTKASRSLEFDCLATRDVTLDVRDFDGSGCMAALTIKDARGRVYPPQAMRLAPDMFFHEQIYRADGETVRLPDGEYTVASRRGPEYIDGTQTVRIAGSQDRIRVKLERWIDPSRWGWYSGDTHIHAAGCAHYQAPTEGVTPETMIRHVRGEGLSIGEVLTWGPDWYYQKQFFSGKATSPAATLEHPELQVANNATWQPRATPRDKESLLRYDIEVSGFPSSLCGHLVLLRLEEQDYPGTRLIEDWPSWNLPILQWAKSQGALVGYAHCALGMEVQSRDLPNYEIPPFDSIGTNEAIVDVTHGVTDFLSGCDLFPVAELNAWYHLLNCGFRLAMAGETDYPCVTGERPGVGRTYVQLSRRPVDDAGYEEWIEGLRRGRLYCGDGRSHIPDFRVENRHSGEELALAAPGVIKVRATVAARLDPEVSRQPDAVPAGALRRWHLEDARIGTTREVRVELVVNGLAVDETTIVADGKPREVRFQVSISESAWVALRIFPSVHAHPVFITVGGRPIRASKRSAKWCRNCVDKLWEVKAPFMRESERASAADAFDHARKAYETIERACERD